MPTASATKMLRMLRRGGVRAAVALPQLSPLAHAALNARRRRQNALPPQWARALSTLGDAEERIISALVVNRPGTLAQIADVFGSAGQNITGLCVRSTVVPELSRVTITCRLPERELAGLHKRLRALVALTFFHVTSVAACVDSKELLLRAQALVQVARDDARHAQLLALLDKYGGEVVLGQDSAVIPADGLSLPHTDAINDATAVGTEPDDDALFLHVAHEPAQLDAFVRELRAHGFVIRELQTCGPLFLDTSQSTLDADSAASFTHEVAAEVAKLLTMPPLSDAQLPPTNAEDAAGTLEEAATHRQHAEIMDAAYRRQLQSTSTFKLYTNRDGYFSSDRLRLHARIAHQLYELAPQDLAAPRFVLLIGIPGAGKSTVLGHLELIGQLKLGDFVNFDVDDVIALLPEFYHAMLNVGLGNAPPRDSEPPARPLPGPQLRYQMCRDEARFILKKNLYSAIMCRKNVILHGSGKSLASYASLLDQVQAAGFDAHVVCLDIPAEVAYERVAKRSNGYGRDVPPALVDLTASLITRHFRRLADRVPNAHLFDSVEMPPRLVWSKQESHVVVQDASDPIQARYLL
ncbi:hypothetical protein PybrP1_007877 [[Pythium] brassicae (nom. inval.)]|nr:hypothetical protein PybrP1_007877 [[Pythium] brassicae (nom. inval.)]